MSPLSKIKIAITNGTALNRSRKAKIRPYAHKFDTFNSSALQKLFRKCHLYHKNVAQNLSSTHKISCTFNLQNRVKGIPEFHHLVKKKAPSCLHQFILMVNEHLMKIYPRSHHSINNISLLCNSLTVLSCFTRHSTF